MTSSFLNQFNEVLVRLSNDGLVGLKSEYESEGIRPSELSTTFSSGQTVIISKLP